MALLHGWRYCPRCKGELAHRDGAAACGACGFVAYANSAPTTNALVEDGEGRVLLARRGIEPDMGKWDVIGGFLDEYEHPLDGLRREVREETGLEVEPGEFVCATVDWYGEGPDAVATLNLTWTARILSGEPAPEDDVAELRWFTPDELPHPDELAFRRISEVLAAWRSLRAE